MLRQYRTATVDTETSSVSPIRHCKFYFSHNLPVGYSPRLDTVTRQPASQPASRHSVIPYRGNFFVHAGPIFPFPFSSDTFFAESNIIHPAVVNNLIMRERKRLRNRICDLLSDPIFEKVKTLRSSSCTYSGRAALRAMVSDVTTEKQHLLLAAHISPVLLVITAQETR